MEIGIFGLGYVGLTTAACLLQRGFKVSGYEYSEEKRNVLLAGRCPLSEPGVAEVISGGIKDGNFMVSEVIDPQKLPDVIFISVGTPSDERGATNLAAVDAVFGALDAISDELGAAGVEVILRSTVPPGTLEKFAIKYPKLFTAVVTGFYPEFLREGTAMSDFENPPQTVLGIMNGREPVKMAAIFDKFSFEYSVVSVLSAESLKFACNAFHALKVAFANEFGRLISSYGGDAVEVMKLFIRDRQLNISERYLLPGAPYGGSCLPKDTRSIRHISVSRGLNLATIESCEVSNSAHFNYIVGKVMQLQPSKIALLGLAFKKNTDDIRESPTVELLYRFAAYPQLKLSVFDFLVDPEAAVGVNQKLLEKVVSMREVTFSSEPSKAVVDADVVIVLHDDEKLRKMAEESGKKVIDLARWSGL